MKKTLPVMIGAVAGLVIMSANPLWGQTDAKALLKQDVVKLVAGGFAVEEYGTVLPMNSDAVALKLTASAPANLMSRDRFLAVYSSFSTALVITTMKDMDLKASDDLIIRKTNKTGEPIKITVDIKMTSAGVSYKVVAAGYKSGSQVDWDQFFF